MNRTLRRKRPSIAMEIVQDYVLHVLVVVRENAKAVREVARMAVKHRVAMGADKDAKGAVNKCVKAIA